MYIENRSQVLKSLLDLDDSQRSEVLNRIAGDEDGDPVDMYVAANMVMSQDQFREAKMRLTDRGYAVDFVNAS